MKRTTILTLFFVFMFTFCLHGTKLTSKAQDTKILKIGNTVPMQSKEGIQIKNWLELLSSRLNESGGLAVNGEKYKIEIVSYDDEYSADTGRAAAERLIYQDKVKHIICQWGSAPIVATLQVAEPNKVLMIGNGMTEKTMEPKWHYVYRAPSMFWINGLQAAFVEYFKKQGFPMTVVIINPDDVTGRGASKKNSILYKNLGVKVLDTLFYKRDTSDYTPFATKIKSLNPGFVDMGTTPGGAPSLLLAKALYDVGYEGGKIMNNVGDTVSEIVQKVSPEALKDTVSGVKDPRLYREDDWVLELCEAYEERYGVWETDAINWIAGWFAFITAVKQADSLEVDDLVKALDGMKFDGLDYTREFVARPDMNNPRTADSCGQSPVGIVKNGKLEILKIGSIEENYRKTIETFGLEDAYGLD